MIINNTAYVIYVHKIGLLLTYHKLTQAPRLIGQKNLSTETKLTDFETNIYNLSFAHSISSAPCSTETFPRVDPHQSPVRTSRLRLPDCYICLKYFLLI